MFHTKKSILTTIFTFFIFSHISALNVQDADTDTFLGMESTCETSTNTTVEATNTTIINIQSYNFSHETDTEKLVSYTITHEDRIFLAQDYYNKETGDSEHGMMQIYPDISLMNEERQSFDLPSNLNFNDQNLSISDTTNDHHSSDRQQEHNDLNNKLKDDAINSRRQEIEKNPDSQTHIQQNNIHAKQRQNALQELNKLHTSSANSKNIFALPSVQAHFKQFKYEITEKYRDKKVFFFSRKKTFPTAESEIKFADALSIKVGRSLSQIRYANQIDAKKAAFAELKELWPWKRDHTFLTSSFVNGTGETGFILRLGIDIMAIAERDLISQPDYIAQHTDTESFKVIQEFREKCIALQQKGNRNALLEEEFKLRQELFKNGKNDNLTTNICYAIVQKIYSDSITNVLYEIVHAQSLEKAHNQLRYLEMQILDQAQQYNVTLTNQIKDFIVKQYGFDLIEAAYNCYASRPDYIKTVNDKPLLSNNNVSSILDNIEHKALPIAHKELTHLQKQIAGTFESLNITDRALQKELIVKKFGIDILEQAHKKYEARSDHKILAESFMPIDVNQACATILENNNTYESVAHEMSDLAQRVFVNARYCNLSNLPKIELHVYDSIDAMRTAQDHPTFIFNFSIVNHTLGDIQQIAHAILSGTHPVMQRSSELLITGFTAFFKGLNPITQISNMGHLASELGSLLGKGGTALWNDPITAMHNGITTTFTLTELIRNSADFASDLTVGRLYLSPEEYKQRTDTFYAMMEPLQGVTADHCFKFVGQLIADVFTTKGVVSAYKLLKEIDILSKAGESAAAVSRIFKKGFDTHLADNPVVITAEGIVLKMSNGMKDFNNGPREIINSAKALLESIYTPIAEILIAEIELLKAIELPYGFAEFSEKQIKIAYEHILGLEIKWSDKANELSKLSGFHLDVHSAIEKSKIIDFTRKFMNEHACYSAVLKMDGMRPIRKTFFPSHWSRKKVSHKIIEAYNEFKSSKRAPLLAPDGKYKITGFVEEGFEIEMYLTKKGVIASAYPIVKEIL